ncbi:MAG: putative toxin-antitoxin system toxin component, PIN family [Bacteroidota bacterium]|nr:putative toxin-antitoxin system toxin component, PIN family [Bacteroidota bacterium]
MKNNVLVIDTNTLISAFLFTHSTTKLAYDKARQSGKISASLETYNEFCNVLVRPKFDKYISLGTRLGIINDLKELLVFKEISESINVCRDPKDNKFLELAVAAKASCIITGDDDLLILHPFREIPILNAADFLNTF